VAPALVFNVKEAVLLPFFSPSPPSVCLAVCVEGAERLLARSTGRKEEEDEEEAKEEEEEASPAEYEPPLLLLPVACNLDPLLGLGVVALRPD